MVLTFCGKYSVEKSVKAEDDICLKILFEVTVIWAQGQEGASKYSLGSECRVMGLTSSESQIEQQALDISVKHTEGRAW